MKKLFMFYVGGDCKNSNIELHDIRFSIGEKPADCYDDLRRQWWGTPKSLHLDCWAAVEQADGYDIELNAEPSDDKRKLFFLNMGGYDGREFGELHKNIFLVAENSHQAGLRALKEMHDWKSPHRDNILEIEKIISVSDLFQKDGYHIHLKKAGKMKEFTYTCRFTKLY